MRNFLYHSIFILVLLISSCKVVDEDPLKKPDIEISSDRIYVSLAYKTDTKYINIFRKEYKTSPTGDEPVINIGEIIPSSKELESYIFCDEFLVSGVKYTYCARYMTKTGYVYTDWTDWPLDKDEKPVDAVTTLYLNDGALKFAIPSDTYFEYSEKTKCFTLKGSKIEKIDSFDGFESSICISNSNDTRIFPLGDAGVFSDGIDVNSKIDLRTILSKDFFDTDIKIEGILYEKNDTADKKYSKVIWSQISEIKIKDEKGKELESVNIPLNLTTDSLHDFSLMKSAKTDFNML